MRSCSALATTDATGARFLLRVCGCCRAMSHLGVRRALLPTLPQSGHMSPAPDLRCSPSPSLLAPDRPDHTSSATRYGQRYMSPGRNVGLGRCPSTLLHEQNFMIPIGKPSKHGTPFVDRHECWEDRPTHQGYGAGEQDCLRIWTWASILASATSQTGRPRHGVTQGVLPELGRGQGVTTVTETL